MVRVTRIHSTADVSPTATVGEGSTIWHNVHIREHARLGRECVVGKDAYIDHSVVIGDRVKIQNRASIYFGTTIEDGVFVGPHVVFTNDLRPRAVTPDGRLKRVEDWTVEPIIVRRGASIGASSVILPGVVIGPFALVGAGAVVTKAVPAHGLVLGNPARLAGYVCACGGRATEGVEGLQCSICGALLDID